MNAETFAEWLRRQGYRIYKTHSSYWYNAGPGVLQAFPYHWIIEPSDEEIRELMLRNRILALRYSAPQSNRDGKISYHIVQSKNYGMESLRQKARNGVKRGLEHFKVEEISFNRLAKEGWKLQEDTLVRQNRTKSMTQKQWECLCKSAEGLQGFHAYGALHGEELAGAVITSRIDDVFSVPFAMSHSRFLTNHVNNALFFSVSSELIKKDEIREVFFTVQSLDAPEHLDDFKLRMGFQLRIVRQKVEFHPYLRPFMGTSLYSISRKLMDWYPSSPALAKCEGMMRFHLEGKQPTEEQALPDCLKGELLTSS
jgi:hypothetical protein